MANRYWVGGTANWDGTAGTKWATTSGGTGGASVPSPADDVFFSNLSTGTCTISAGNGGAKSINCTGFAGTITGTSGINVGGSITLSAGMTYTHSGTIVIIGAGTLTTAGKTFSTLTINGSGITVTLGDALTLGTRTLTIQTGTFNTANYNVTAGIITSNNSNTRTITLGSSTVTSQGAAGLNIATSTGLTFNAGTSQINLTTGSASLSATSQTFYNVSFTSSQAGTRIITGANTFNNLTLNASSSGLSALSINSNQTVNGTLTCAGVSAIARGFVRSDIIGTTRTITANAISADDCDFRDITLAGTASGASPTRAGDCGGNSGITFPATKTVYFNFASTANWNSTAWATTPSGTPNISNFPLAQDTATFTDSGSASTVATIFGFNIGTLDASGRTSAMTLNLNGTCNFYGNFTLGSGVTIAGTSTQTLSGRGTQTFTSAGKTITFGIIIDAPFSTFSIAGAFTSSNGIILNRGTFNANNYNLTCTSFSSNNALVRTISMGSGLWTLSGTINVWTTATTTNLTFNKDTANILLSDSTTTGRNFNGGTLSFNKLTIGGATGTSTTAISSANTFTELASTKTVAHTIRFSDSQTINTWAVTGTAGNVVTVNSAIVGTRVTINLTNVTSGIDYLNVSDIGVSDVNKFYVGANSTDGGNNLNVYFTASPGGGISVSILELLTLTDSSFGEGLFLVSTTESETLTDTQSNNATFDGTVTESVTESEAQDVIAIFSSGVIETTPITSVEFANAIFTLTTTESEALSDIAIGQREFTYNVTELETITDTTAATYLFVGSTIEPIVLTDAVTSLAIFNSAQLESFLLTDKIIGRGWFAVQDGQTSDWVLINDNQASAWQEINKVQSPDWQNIDDAQS